MVAEPGYYHLLQLPHPFPAPALNASTSACNAAKSAMISLSGCFGDASA